MTKYSNGVYGGFKYGDTPKLVFSAAPVTTEVLAFNQVQISFTSPSGTFTRFRIVRNQNGFPSTPEDGVIIYQLISLDGSSLAGTIPFTSFIDGVNNPTSIPLVAGQNVYYTIFLYTSNNVWVNAGQVTDVIPKDTDAMAKFMNSLPRTLISNELSPLGTLPLKTDTNKSDFYNFMDAFMFTYEQFLTQISLIRPKYNFDSCNYYTIPTEAYSVGLNLEPNIPVNNQRRLIRDAIYLYSQKGTAIGIQDYSKDLTNFDTVVTTSPNLMLSVQESTFYNGTGNWVATNGTLTSSTDLVPDTNPSNQIDNTYIGKFVASSSSGAINIGFDYPILNGVPVTANTAYVVSMKIKSPTSAGNVTLSVQGYDKNGNTVGSLTSSTATAAVNAWSSISKTFTTGTGVSYLGIQISVSASGTYYFDQICVQAGSTVSYDEARALTLTLNPTKNNYINNPSFTVDFTGWSYTGLTASQDSTNVSPYDFAGANSAKLVTTGAWTFVNSTQIPVDPGTYFVVSAYVQSLNISSMNMYIDFYDVNNNLLSTITNPVTVSSSWSRVYTRGLITSNTTASYAKIRFSGSTAGTLWMDMVQAEDSYLPTDYIDGSMPESIGVIWSGTANNSSSLYYPDKDVRFLRLAQTLPDWVPINTFWRISTPAGMVYTNTTTPTP